MSDYQNRSTATTNRFRATLNIGMGIVYLIIGSTVLYIKYFGAMALSSGLAYALGSLMLLYGIFRLWRGIVDLRK